MYSISTISCSVSCAVSQEINSSSSYIILDKQGVLLKRIEATYYLIHGWKNIYSKYFVPFTRVISLEFHLQIYIIFLFCFYIQSQTFSHSLNFTILTFPFPLLAPSFPFHFFPYLLRLSHFPLSLPSPISSLPSMIIVPTFPMH